MMVKDALMDVMREIEIMKRLSHGSVIRLHEVIQDDEGDKLYMVLDYAENGQIMNWDETALKFSPCIKNKQHFSEKDIQKIARDCIRGLDYSNYFSP